MTAITTTLGLGLDQPGSRSNIAGEVTVDQTLRDIYTDIAAMATCGNAVRVDVNACITAHNGINAKLDADTTLDVDTYVSGNNVTATAAAFVATLAQANITEFQTGALLLGNKTHVTTARLNLARLLYDAYQDVIELITQVNALRTDTIALHDQLVAVGVKLDADDLADLDTDYASVLAHTLTATAVTATMPTVTETTFARDDIFRPTHQVNRPNLPMFLRTMAADLASVRAALVALRTDRATQLTEMTAYVAKLDADPLEASDYAATNTPAAATSSAPAALLTTAA